MPTLDRRIVLSISNAASRNQHGELVHGVPTDLELWASQAIDPELEREVVTEGARLEGKRRWTVRYQTDLLAVRATAGTVTDEGTIYRVTFISEVAADRWPYTRRRWITIDGVRVAPQ